jgi:hypothetical protein
LTTCFAEARILMPSLRTSSLQYVATPTFVDLSPNLTLAIALNLNSCLLPFNIATRMWQPYFGSTEDLPPPLPENLQPTLAQYLQEVVAQRELVPEAVETTMLPRVHH